MKSIEQVESIQDLKDIRNECSGRSVFRPFHLYFSGITCLNQLFLFSNHPPKQLNKCKYRNSKHIQNSNDQIFEWII